MMVKQQQTCSDQVKKEIVSRDIEMFVQRNGEQLGSLESEVN
jgi:hypothetical protein